jgi:hypothetical protein
MNITGEFDPGNYIPRTSGAFTEAGNSSQEGGTNYSGKRVYFNASRTWTGSTSSASPQTSALGSGQALDITPSYYTCHMWLRIS